MLIRDLDSDTCLLLQLLSHTKKNPDTHALIHTIIIFFTFHIVYFVMNGRWIMGHIKKIFIFIWNEHKFVYGILNGNDVVGANQFHLLSHSTIYAINQYYLLVFCELCPNEMGEIDTVDWWVKLMMWDAIVKVNRVAEMCHFFLHLELQFTWISREVFLFVVFDCPKYVRLNLL